MMTGSSIPECSRTALAAYVDGELTPDDELKIELHVAGCPQCATELNEQKRLLTALDSALFETDEIEIPADFAHVVATRAESNVRGLRCPRERSQALKVAAIISGSLVLILAVGTDAARGLVGVSLIFEQIIAVGGFLLRMLGDAVLAVALLLRTVFSHLFQRSNAGTIGVMVVFVFSLLIFSRLMLGQRRP